MTKPTPGPYKALRTPGNSFYLWAGNSLIGRFDNDEVPIEQAEANARAWVEGRDAMEKLERIRGILAEMGDAPGVLGPIAITRIINVIGLVPDEWKTGEAKP